jgi:hypothetical protein
MPDHETAGIVDAKIRRMVASGAIGRTGANETAY